METVEEYRRESVQEERAQDVARVIVVKEVLAKSAEFLRGIVDMGEGLGITLTCLPALSSIPSRRLHLVGHTRGGVRDSFKN